MPRQRLSSLRQRRSRGDELNWPHARVLCSSWRALTFGLRLSQRSRHFSEALLLRAMILLPSERFLPPLSPQESSASWIIGHAGYQPRAEEHYFDHQSNFRSEEHTSELQSPCNLVC